MMPKRECIAVDYIAGRYGVYVCSPDAEPACIDWLNEYTDAYDYAMQLSVDCRLPIEIAPALRIMMLAELPPSARAKLLAA